MKQNLVKTERFLTENFIKYREIKLKYRMKFALILFNFHDMDKS